MTTRPLYLHEDMHRLFAPTSIAIVGASARPGSFGRSTLQNLSQYTGTIYLVSPTQTEIDGKPAYRSVRDLPAVPDCVVVAVPRGAVARVVEDCAAINAGGAIIYASGYAETATPETVQLQADLTQLAARTGLKILGPNCLGIVNYVNRAMATFSPCPQPDKVLPASIGLVSQSGALAHAMGQGIARGVSFSHLLAAGNSCDIDVADMVAYLATDPNCKVIACIFEGMSNPRRLFAAAELAWRAGKPLLIYKLATGELGAAAAASHTGSLAGSHASYRAAFERCGAIVVDDFEAMLEMAAFFAKAPAPLAAGAAVVATSGGASVMCADKAELHNVPLSQPSAAAKAVLERHIPDFGSSNNPCDVTAQVVNDPASLAACCEALAADPAYGAIIVPSQIAYDAATPRFAMVSEIARRHGKIACCIWLSQWLEGPGAKQCEQNEGVALFRSADNCFATLAAWQLRHAQAGRRSIDDVGAPHAAREQVAAQLKASAGGVVTETAAKALLRQYGIPVVTEELTVSADAAVAAAAQAGYPVAVKVQSPDILHKTDAGVLQLNLKDDAAVRAAYAEVMRRALMVATADRIDGVVVQPMINSGLEVMVGAKIDPLFGPVVVVGLGGIFVELLRDTQLAIAPVTAVEAKALLHQLKGAAVLKGFRGAEPVDIDVLASVVASISQFAADQAAYISEFDVNPLICSGSRIIAVDAVIVCAPASAAP